MSLPLLSPPFVTSLDKNSHLGTLLQNILTPAGHFLMRCFSPDSMDVFVAWRLEHTI
jgi:hypothetical protein